VEVVLGEEVEAAAVEGRRELVLSVVDCLELWRRRKNGRVSWKRAIPELQRAGFTLLVSQASPELCFVDLLEMSPWTRCRTVNTVPSSWWKTTLHATVVPWSPPQPCEQGGRAP